MAKFIKYLNGKSASLVVEYLSVDQVASAKYHAKARLLEIATIGNSWLIEIHGDDAVAAAKLLDRLS